MTINEVLEKTDWEQLANQKRLLLRAIEAEEKRAATRAAYGAEPGEATDELEGLLNWIDALQDAAEDAGYPVVWLTEPELQ